MVAKVDAAELQQSGVWFAEEQADYDRKLSKLDKKQYTPEYLATLTLNDKKYAYGVLTAPEAEVSEPVDVPSGYIHNPIEIEDENGNLKIVATIPETTVGSNEETGYIHNPIEVENEDGELVVVSATDSVVDFTDSASEEEDEAEESSEEESVSVYDSVE